VVIQKVKLKKNSNIRGTNSLPLGSIWEVGLTASFIHKQCRIYLKPADKEPEGAHIYVDEKNGQEYMINNGKKVYFCVGDKRPEATYIYLGKKGGRYVISEDKVTQFLKKWSTLSLEQKRTLLPKPKMKTKEVKTDDLWK
jgi:hypothetical protein